MRSGASRVVSRPDREPIDLVAVIAPHVELKRAGSEWEGCCPFHSERTPSFKVSPAKGFFHCFGCGAHGDDVGFLMQLLGLSFQEAHKQARGAKPAAKSARFKPTCPVDTGATWVPIYPVPDDAPLIAAGIQCAVWNSKRGRVWKILATRADPYLDARGRLIGFVLRVEFADGVKITPTVTYCIGPKGEMRWCLQPFSKPRPLCGLEELAARPNAPVLVVEGEKCKAVAAAALPQYVVVTWPGGSKGVRHADFSPLAGRAVVLWPDADEGGREAMLGYVMTTGALRDGVAQHAWRAGCASLRYVDTSAQPKGWDVADALGQDGWSAKQLAAWAALHVCDIAIDYQPSRRAA